MRLPGRRCSRAGYSSGTGKLCRSWYPCSKEPCRGCIPILHIARKYSGTHKAPRGLDDGISSLPGCPGSAWWPLDTAQQGWSHTTTLADRRPPLLNPIRLCFPLAFGHKGNYRPGLVQRIPLCFPLTIGHKKNYRPGLVQRIPLCFPLTIGHTGNYRPGLLQRFPLCFPLTIGHKGNYRLGGIEPFPLRNQQRGCQGQTRPNSNCTPGFRPEPPWAVNTFWCRGAAPGPASS